MILGELQIVNGRHKQATYV